MTFKSSYTTHRKGFAVAFMWFGFKLHITHPIVSNILTHLRASCNWAIVSLLCKFIASDSWALNKLTRSLFSRLYASSSLGLYEDAPMYIKAPCAVWKSPVLSTILSFRLASKKARQFSRLVGSYSGVPSSLSFKVSLRSFSVGNVSLFVAGASIDLGDLYFSRISSEVSEK